MYRGAATLALRPIYPVDGDQAIDILALQPSECGPLWYAIRRVPMLYNGCYAVLRHSDASQLP